MERLTERLHEGCYGVAYCVKKCDGSHRICEHDPETCPAVNDCFDKLGRLEDLQEAGRLVELTFKVGEAVWVYNSMQSFIEEKTIWEVIIGTKHDALIFTDGMQFTVWDKDWAIACRFLFHTREEAEAALKGGDLDE